MEESRDRGENWGGMSTDSSTRGPRRAHRLSPSRACNLLPWYWAPGERGQLAREPGPPAPTPAKCESTTQFKDADVWSLLQFRHCCCCCLVIHSVVPKNSSVPGILGKNTRVGYYALLQGIFPTLGSNPGLPHYRQILYCLSHQGSPNRSREVCLFGEKLINTKLPAISMAPLLSQKALRWYLNESHSALHVPKVKAPSPPDN